MRTRRCRAIIQWQRNVQQINQSAVDRGVRYSRSHHPAHKICYGTHVVHEDPEVGKRMGLDKNTTKEETKSEQQVGDIDRGK